MELIEKLNSELLRGKLVGYGLYKCPVCGNSFKWRTTDITSGRKNNCGCTRHLEVLPDILNGNKVVDDKGVVDGRRVITIMCMYCTNTYDAVHSSVKRGVHKRQCGCQRNTPRISCKLIKPVKKTLIEKCSEALNISMDDSRRLYYTWKSMLRRCYSLTHPKYYNYGGRGISVCDVWRNDFMRFVKDMGSKPDASLSIDRINNDGNYEPSNCRWATDEQQNNNQRRSNKYK